MGAGFCEARVLKMRQPRRESRPSGELIEATHPVEVECVKGLTIVV